MDFTILDLSGDTDIDNPATSLQELLERYSIRPDVHYLRVYKKVKDDWVTKIVQITPLYENNSIVNISIKKDDGSFYHKNSQAKVNSKSMLNALHELGLLINKPRNKVPKTVVIPR